MESLYNLTDAEFIISMVIVWLFVTGLGCVAYRLVMGGKEGLNGS